MIPPIRTIAPDEIPALVPVLLYIARFHPYFQGISGSYRKFICFPLAVAAAVFYEFQLKAQAVGQRLHPDPTAWAIMTDGAEWRLGASADVLTGTLLSLYVQRRKIPEGGISACKGLNSSLLRQWRS
jgi:hypothetical protein